MVRENLREMRDTRDAFHNPRHVSLSIFPITGRSSCTLGKDRAQGRGTLGEPAELDTGLGDGCYCSSAVWGKPKTTADVGIGGGREFVDNNGGWG